MENTSARSLELSKNQNKIVPEVKVNNLVSNFETLSNYDNNLLFEWHPLLQILRWAGQLPIQIIKIPVTTENFNPKITFKFHFKFVLKSLILYYSLVLGFIRLCVWIVPALLDKFNKSTAHPNATSLLETVSTPEDENIHMFSDRNYTRMEQFVEYVYIYALPVVNIGEWLCVIFNTPLFVLFLNNWNQFHDSLYLPGKSKQRNSLNLKLISMIVIGPNITFFSFIIYFRLRLIYSSLPYYKLVSKIIQSTLLHLITLIEDVKIILMCRSTTAGFRQVNTNTL